MSDDKRPKGDSAPAPDPETEPFDDAFSGDTRPFAVDQETAVTLNPSVQQVDEDQQTAVTLNPHGGDTALFEWNSPTSDVERTSLGGSPVPSGSGVWSPDRPAEVPPPANRGTIRLEPMAGNIPGLDVPPSELDSTRPITDRTPRTEGTVIVPQENIAWTDETEQSLDASRLHASRPATAAERDEDPWTHERTELDADPDTDPSLPQVHGFGSDSDNDNDAQNVEHTVMLDPEMQDRLMALRAQQDQVLKARFTGDVVVMFTDLVGSTSYYERHGDLMGRQKMLTHNALLFPIIRTHNGTVIKTIGDAIMCCFDDVDPALTAAEEMQRALEAFNRGCEDPDEEIHIRIGINSGPVIAEDGDLHGDAVNVAARVEAKAQGDQILVSESVKAAAKHTNFEPMGRVAFKGKAERVGVYLLGWSDSGSSHAQMGPRLVDGRYQLGDTIGRGPDGVVYAAEDTQLRQPVAIKLLHDHVILDNERYQRLSERFVGLASLRHEGIVRLLDFSSMDADEPYYIMDRIEGPDLSTWVSQNGSATPLQAAGLVLDAARAVAHAHEHGVIHGNIKPENMFVKPDGKLMLGDFGIAAEDRVQSTMTATSVASPAFQAPEQVTGLELTERTDVYGLGAVLYFLLAGQPPYDIVASLRNMRAVASGTCKRLGLVRSGLPKDIVDITERAMEPRPEARFATVAQLEEALASFCSGDGRGDGYNDSQRPTAHIPSLADIPTGGRGSEPTLQARPIKELIALRRALMAVSLVAGVAVVTAGIALVFLLRSESDPGTTELVVGASATPAKPRDRLRVVRGNAKGKTPIATGRLHLTTAPWPADVYIDDDKIGRTPQLKAIDLPAGSYRLRVVNPKRQPYIEQVQIIAGKTVKKKVKLKAPK